MSEVPPGRPCPMQWLSTPPSLSCTPNILWGHSPGPGVPSRLVSCRVLQGYLAHKTPLPPAGPCSSPVPRDLWRS